MSSILKALKKLEEEKARQKGVQVDLMQNILRSDSRHGDNRPWRLPVLVLALLLVGGLAGMVAVIWLQPPLTQLEPGLEAGPPQVSATPVPASTTAPEQPVSVPLSLTESTLPAAAGADLPAAEPVAVVAPTPAIQPRAGQVDDSTGLIVSGIVYQQDPSSRIAIVNDLPVMAGTPIEDATVEEILTDRVRFSRHGKSFDVLLQD